jgi:hypothetical protein
MIRKAAGALFAVWLLLAGMPPVMAHEIRPAVATLAFSPGLAALDISLNLEALLAGINPAHRDTDEAPQAQRYNALRALPPGALAERWRDYEPRYLDAVTLLADDTRLTARVAALDIPAGGDDRAARISRLRVEAPLPAGSRELRLQFDPVLGPVVARFPATDGSLNAVWLKDGGGSAPQAIGSAAPPASRAAVAGQYTLLGFTHILPHGLDHILFVLGLFLLSAHWRPLLIQVTAFTVAHTLTLALSVHGIVSLPASLVEPLIAASIVYVAVENIATTRLHAWRPFIVFGFGLLHGMGFAGVLQALGLPPGEALTALISFNVGVELGQLAVISLAWLAVGHWFRERPWYHRGIVSPLSALIALTGAWWTVERLLPAIG